MMQVYDRVLASRGLWTLILLGVALVMAFVTAGVLDWARARLLTRVGVKLDERVAPSLMRTLLARRGGESGKDSRRTQALRDFDTVRQVTAGAGAIAAMDLPWAIIFLIILGMLHWTLVVVGVAGMGIIVALSIWNDRSVRDRIARANDAALTSYAALEHSTGVADAIAAMGMRTALVAKHSSERAEATDLQTEASLRSSYFQSSIKFLRLGLQSFVLGWGAFLAIGGDITPGAMIAATILMTRFLQPIEQLNVAWPQVVRARSAFANLKPLLDAADADDECTPLPSPKGRLQVDRIVVGRPQGEPVLKSVSMSLEPGEIVGVVGASGSGKTTLARVIVGAVAPQAGAVRVDGAELSQWPPDLLGAVIGYLPQGLQLVPGSIFDNISRFRAHLGEDRDALAARAVAAAQAADAHALILSLPRGYDTQIGTNGAGLSGGQSQRIALARALFDDPAILVLDEPNAFLDADGEGALLRCLTAARARGRAILLIAHRGSVMSVCDRLIVLRDGRVDLSGPREEVMSKLSEAAAQRRPAAVSAISGVAGGQRP
jgi:ATP-binding cassette subfamily C protein